MNSPASNDPESDLSEPAAPGAAPTPHDHLDPITGEPHAHPVGVGVGALSAGAAGAAIGAFAGPIGVIVGAAIGAIAGGLAGKEVAESPEISPTSEEGGTLDDFDHSASEATTEEGAVPLPSAISERTNPTDDDFFTGGHVSGQPDLAAEPPLDEFDRPHAAAVPVTAASHAATAFEDKPLPTASSGLITPDEDSFFADSTTGESSVLVEHPYPAAHAVSPGDHFADVATEPASAGALDTEQTIRTGAYYRYLGRETTGEPGSEFGDWIAAEKEVLRR